MASIHPPRRGLLVATAVALAVVLAAAVGTLVVRRAGALDSRLTAVEPGIRDVARAFTLDPRPRQKDFARRPCRVNALVGATAPKSIGWTFPADGRAAIRQVEVSVFVLDEPERRLGDLERGLTECGGFDSVFGDEPYRFTTHDVRREGGVLRWRLTGSGAGHTSGARARASVVGPYLLYVLDHRLGSDPPPSYVEAFADEVEDVLRESL